MPGYKTLPDFPLPPAGEPWPQHVSHEVPESLYKGPITGIYGQAIPGITNKQPSGKPRDSIELRQWAVEWAIRSLPEKAMTINMIRERADAILVWLREQEKEV